MPELSYIQQSLPVDNRRVMLVDDNGQSTDEIIRYIADQHRLNKGDSSKIASHFWKGNARDTGRELFKFCKQNIHYKVEPEKDQTIKTLGRVLHDGYGDCKHYALFITGVCEALRRQGYPIHAVYRFVADSPGMEVHHVFSVIDDGNQEYWCDPVLDSYNEQPNFYNIKDADMAISRLSGTGNAYNPLPIVGRKKRHHKNIFKNIAHGLEVDAHNAGKEIAKDAKEIKKVVLKVGVAPARNAFLALLDINAFNLAKKMNAALNNRKESAGVQRLWKDLGGNPKKLAHAIANGHNKKRIGVIAIASAIALASAIIAAFDKYLHNTPEEKAAMADAGKEGAKHLIKHVSDGIDNANGEGDGGNEDANALNVLAKGKDGGPQGSMSVSTGTDADGNPVLAVHDVDHPTFKNAGTPDDGSGDDGGGDQATTPAAPGGSFSLSDMIGKAKTFIMDNKVPVGLGVAGIVMYKYYSSQPKSRRRK